jgi:hypothetical protein
LRRLGTRGTGIIWAFTCKWTYEIYIAHCSVCS